MLRIPVLHAERTILVGYGVAAEMMSDDADGGCYVVAGLSQDALNLLLRSSTIEQTQSSEFGIDR